MRLPSGCDELLFLCWPEGECVAGHEATLVFRACRWCFSAVGFPGGFSDFSASQEREVALELFFSVELVVLKRFGVFYARKYAAVVG